ncbi:TRAP transporter small permease [Thiothrix subterranea]|uniref:TRAP transporter small permease protein n=1 Tax=Thiothrix subterranea TaxID=2735563 RepID=A0AA51ML44_9GAMM|nr:TRAP transporter small permease [Thiothrix subterranea]MDQ5769292.1 TRAP transporter small permease [Thiothrix subterranea]WML86275.1 TRAP transporter small permease [Thiothrix subterranea]
MSAENRHKSALIKQLERPLEWGATLSGFLLLGIMLLVAVSVMFRYLFNQPILGSQEIVQMGMVVVVMLAMPSTADRDMHIRVDILDKALGEHGRFFADLIGRIVGIVVLSLLVWRSAIKALDAFEYADTTNMLAIPVWPIYSAIVIGMALYVLILLFELTYQLTGWGIDHD